MVTAAVHPTIGSCITTGQSLFGGARMPHPWCNRPTLGDTVMDEGPTHPCLTARPSGGRMVQDTVKSRRLASSSAYRTESSAQGGPAVLLPVVALLAGERIDEEEPFRHRENATWPKQADHSFQVRWC